jgi:hypothetical protein
MWKHGHLILHIHHHSKKIDFVSHSNYCKLNLLLSGSRSKIECFVKIFVCNNLQAHFYLSNLIYICHNSLFYQAFVVTLFLWHTCHLLILWHLRYQFHKNTGKYLGNYCLNIFQKRALIHREFFHLSFLHMFFIIYLNKQFDNLCCLS